jgi:hypothetical protein
MFISHNLLIINDEFFTLTQFKKAKKFDFKHQKNKPEQFNFLILSKTQK